MQSSQHAALFTPCCSPPCCAGTCVAPGRVCGVAAEFPLPTARVDAAFDACRKVLLEHLQRQSLIDHHK